MITFIAYGVTILLSKYNILDLISAPVTILIGFITRIHLIGAVVGFFATYLLLDFLWIKIEGNNIPIVLLLFIMFLNYLTAKTGLLIEEGKTQNNGDQLAVLLYINKLLYFSDNIRWY